MLGLTTPGWDDLCLALFSLRRLGRFPKSIALDNFFLLSPTDGQGWNWTPCLSTSSTTSLPLFSFIVAILEKKDVSHPKKKKNEEKRKRREKRELTSTDCKLMGNGFNGMLKA